MLGGHMDSVQGCYIMTLGVLDECRKLGIGSLLLERTYKEIAYNFNECEIIYLHVVDYNQAAIKFYQKKNDFKYLKVEKNHYEIFDKEYDAEIYFKILEIDQYLPSDMVEF